MIYIRCLLKVIASNIIKTLLIILLSVISAIFLVKKEASLNFIGFSKEENLPKVSFVTSAEDNFQELKNKIIVLPGVKKIDHKDSGSIKDKISLLFKSDVLNEIISQGPQYSKFTIYFKSDVTLKSINLIKSYIIKILSGKEVYFGKVIGVNQEKRVDQNHIFYFFYGINILILLSLYSIFDVNLRKVTYLFQRFQRGKALSYKVSFLSFFTIVVLPSLMTICMVKDIKINNLIIFLVPTMTFFFLLSLKKYKWSN